MTARAVALDSLTLLTVVFCIPFAVLALGTPVAFAVQLLLRFVRALM